MHNTCQSSLIRRSLRISAVWLLPCLLLTLPATVSAQFTYTTNNGTITITKYTGPAGAVTIPDTVNGLPVTSIGDGAFTAWNSGITSVTIPDTVTSIGSDAFYMCYSLASVTIPVSLTRIGDQAFYYCNSVANVAIPYGTTNIGIRVPRCL